MNVYDSLHGRAFHTMLKSYLRMTAKKDWLGRLYGIVNPSIGEDGEVDFNNVIFEADGINTNTRPYVENWFYKQMILISNVFSMDKTGFFDLIDAEISHVGPAEHDNYLVVFDIASRKEMCRYLKKAIKHTLLYAAIGVAVYFTLLK